MLTKEQQAILSHVQASEGLTLISSIAGSGKTTILVAIARAIPHTRGLYLAYNKSVATSSTRKFPKTTQCATTHSLAYQATVRNPSFKLVLGTFTQKQISSKIHYDDRVRIVDHIRTFCLSGFTSFDDYATHYELSTTLTGQCKYHLDLMQAGSIECTHEFYLKLFHILLSSGNIVYPPFDFVMIDEAGDINEVTLEIFKLLPTTRRIAVGDPFQNIYQFNHTINCFKALKGQGTLFRMSKTFRTDVHIAKRIEAFCQSYLDPEMTFQGVNLADKSITTRAYITRTNAALIDRMIDFNRQGIPYGLVRPAYQIFRLPLMLCAIKYQGFITEPEYRHLQADIDDWYENSDLRDQYKSPLFYLSSIYDDDMQLTQAVRLVTKHKKQTIIEASRIAKNHQNVQQNYTLATCHSCKGSEFDEVTIADDLNDSIDDIITNVNSGRDISSLSDSDIESLNLYYVAITRAAKQLNNARHI